jgi:hypothetical protein
MRQQHFDDAEPLPIDGIEVEEIRDADTVRLLVQEWRRRLREQPAPGERPLRPAGMMDA